MRKDPHATQLTIVVGAGVRLGGNQRKRRVDGRLDIGIMWQLGKTLGFQGEAGSTKVLRKESSPGWRRSSQHARKS